MGGMCGSTDLPYRTVGKSYLLGGILVGLAAGAYFSPEISSCVRENLGPNGLTNLLFSDNTVTSVACGLIVGAFGYIPGKIMTNSINQAKKREYQKRVGSGMDSFHQWLNSIGKNAKRSE